MKSRTGQVARRVRIYLDETDKIAHRPAHLVIVEFLRNANCAGATVFRGVEGFGGGGALHTDRLVDVVQRLPLVVEWVDTPERVDRLLGPIEEMVEQALITVEDTHIALHTPQALRRIVARLSAADVMSRDVVSVTGKTPVSQVVTLLLGKVYRAVPVVENGVPIGIVTNTDLVGRGGLGVRIELLPRLDSPEQRSVLDKIAKDRKTVAEIMTPHPVTVDAATPLPQVADLMIRRRLKRVPVTGDEGRLVGMISRVDLLRSVIGTSPARESEPAVIGLNDDVPVSRVMRKDVPTVFPETPVGETLQAVVSTRLNRAVVVSHNRRVLGVVSDAELLERVTPSLRTGVLRSLMHRLPFTRHSEEDLAAEHHSTARTANDLLSSDVSIAREETPLRQAVSAMLRDKQKLIAVVDPENRLVGIVDRADILRGLALPA